MRSEDEIQMRHDVLVGLLLDQELFDAVVDKQSQPAVFRYAEALCWTLNHRHNTAFDDNFKVISEGLKARGLEVFKYPEMQNTGETK